MSFENVEHAKFCHIFFFGRDDGRATPGDVPPKLDEVYQLLRSNLDGLNQSELDRAAVKGLLAQLPGQAMLVSSNGAAASATNALAKVAVFDEAYAYFRIGNVEGSLAEKLRASYNEIATTNKTKIKGVILDLRFAGGTDYAAAGAAADCFLNSDQPLFDWGAGSTRATLKTNAITVPVAILVNAQTTGSAEALAAGLREGDTGLILGSPTAGQANIFKEFSLDNGEKLRIATAPIKLGDGTVLAHGVKPDIAVDASLTDEKEYLEDPYKNLHPASKGKNQTAGTNAPAHRTNEAELVRERRAGEPLDDGSDDNAGDSRASEPAQPVMADAALARALDLLKGLAVVQQSHPG